MKKVELAGRQVPAIGIGTWHMGSSRDNHKMQLQTIQTGINAGAKVIDTAEMYGSGDAEILVGEAIKPYNRTDLFLISKILPSNANKKRLESRLDLSLKRLKTDYLDLYLYHWRGLTPLEETIGELERVRAAGKIKNWGVSNFDTSDLEELWKIPSGKNVAANENLYNLGSRGIEFDLLPWQKDKHLPLIAYSPVGAGNFNHGNEIARHPLVQEVAKRHQSSTYQIMLAWAIRDGSTIAIPQTNNPEHMIDNIAAQDISLTPDDLKLLDEAYPKPTEKEPLAML